MTPMSSSDARKRLAESVERLEARTHLPRFDWLSDYIERLERERAEREFRANPPAWTRPPFRTRALWIDPPRFTVPAHVFTQEDPMTKHDRHAELVALLTEIRDRLPERVERESLIQRNLDAFKHEAETPMRGHGDCCDDPDEALARAIYERADVDEPGTWPPSHPDDLAYWMRLARAAREHIYAEPDQSWVTRDIEEAEGYYRVERARAERAEAERDALLRRLDALRMDLSPGGLTWSVYEALHRDDERAKGERS